ncbi:hypothetical protein ALISP_2389 [Alicycliphilus sp. B1]|nr:hypothetical protein ALISP_2389 [Alicycliphilus sp. B1]
MLALRTVTYCTENEETPQQIAVEDTQVLHGVPGDAEKKGGLGMGDEDFVEVNPLDQVIVRWRGEAGMHAGIGQWQYQAAAGQRDRDVRTLGYTVHSYSINPTPRALCTTLP